MTYSSRFDLGDRVKIDGDVSLIGIVTALQFRLTRSAVAEVSYFHNGEAKAVWIEDFRLDNHKDAE